jgi:hypothetical protein
MEILVLVLIGVFLLCFFIFSDSDKPKDVKKYESDKPSETVSKAEPVYTAEIAESRKREQQRVEEQRRQYEELLRQEQKLRESHEKKRQIELKNEQEALLRLQEQQKQQEAEKQKQQTLKLNSLKENWVSYQDIVQQNSIVKLYHFTDRSNIASIKQNGGLLSWYHCQQNDISIAKPGGSSDSWVLDKRKGLENYVRASFAREHPMMFIAKKEGRVSDPVILEIALDVMYLKSTKFCNQNAVRNGVLVSDSLECFTSINFSVLRKRYFDLSTEDKSYYQAEVLVLEKIPLEYITNINKF